MQKSRYKNPEFLSESATQELPKREKFVFNAIRK